MGTKRERVGNISGFYPPDPKEAQHLHELEWCGEADRQQEVFTVSRDPETYYEIVTQADITPEDYRRNTSPELWALMEKELTPLVGKKGFVISSTYEGGGVAMQQPPNINLLQQLGVDARWLVSEPDDEAFVVTKKMHNLQQDVLADEQFTEEDAKVHTAYGLKNFEGMTRLIPGFLEADFYWVEDPQLAAMIPELKRRNPDATFVYRNHIQTDRDLMATPDSPQNRIYEYLHNQCGVGDVDTYITHPVEQFAPYNTPNLAYMPPTSDPFEDLNRPLSQEEIEGKILWLNGQIAKQNLLHREYYRQNYLKQTGVEPSDENIRIDDQPFLDPDKQWLTGFARFDMAKGQEYNMILQKLITDKLRARNAPEELIPHTIVAGNGATDDPDRDMVLATMLELRRTTYADYADHITVIGFEHDYAAVNTLLGNSMATINFSTKEGFEHRRTESMLKGVPSFSTNAGGLPLQGQDGEGGLVAILDNMEQELDRIADEVVQDILDPARYEARRTQTRDHANNFSMLELSTVANTTRFARILNGKGDKQWKMSELVADMRPHKEASQRTLGASALVLEPEAS